MTEEDKNNIYDSFNSLTGNKVRSLKKSNGAYVCGFTDGIKASIKSQTQFAEVETCFLDMFLEYVVENIKGPGLTK